jgi:4-hydroxybenzoate polyprenyltransferase
MKLLIAFFKLIRSLNLFFIVLTQALFYYCIFPFAFAPQPGIQQTITPTYFWLLSLASVLIAGAGYIINDYFDLNIDQVNKPEKLLVDRVIKRRWTILWHWVFSFAGVAISVYVSWKIRRDFILGIANAGCVLMLLLYSTTFKKKLLLGNIIISILTAWVIMVLFVGEWQIYTINVPAHRDVMSRLFKLAVVYSGFAFIISLVREVVKDIEDMEGDARYGCRTMPIIWGVNVSKMFVAVWLVVLIASILIMQIYVLQYRWWWSVLYSIIFIAAPLVWILKKMYPAALKADFHRLSGAIKFVMLTGILSMLFFKLYM